MVPEPESTTKAGNELLAFDEKLLRMLLHIPFACPLIFRTDGGIPSFQAALGSHLG